MPWKSQSHKVGSLVNMCTTSTVIDGWRDQTWPYQPVSPFKYEPHTLIAEINYRDRSDIDRDFDAIDREQDSPRFGP